MSRTRAFWMMIAGAWLTPLGCCSLLLLAPAVSELFAPDSFFRTPYRDLAWSPDSSQLAFTSDIFGGSDSAYQVYVMNVEGSNLQRLTALRNHADSPVWSPDGEEIAAAVTIAGQTDIYLIDVSRDAMKPLTDDDRYESIPAWSPDGSRLAFWITAREDRPGTIEILNVDTDEQAVVYTAPAGKYASHLVWSPDGEQLAFVQNNRELFVIEQHGENLREYTHDIAFLPSLMWSADGKTLEYQTSLGTASVTLADGEVQRTHKMTEPEAGMLSPDGSLRAQVGCEEFLNQVAPSCSTYKVIITDEDSGQIEATIERDDLIHVSRRAQVGFGLGLIGLAIGPALTLPWLWERKSLLTLLLFGLISSGYGIIGLLVLMTLVGG